MVVAERAGIKVFATGGIGGVHRGAEKTLIYQQICRSWREHRWQWYAAGRRRYSITFNQGIPGDYGSSGYRNLGAKKCLLFIVGRAD